MVRINVSSNKRRENDGLRAFKKIFGMEKFLIIQLKLLSLTRDSATEKESFILINELLKLGDFSVKRLLIELMNSTRDELVLNLCTRLFCSAATHDDLLETNNLKFLSSASEDGVHNFVVSAGETLSYHVVPYLLALLEEWEDTFVEKL